MNGFMPKLTLKERAAARSRLPQPHQKAFTPGLADAATQRFVPYTAGTACSTKLRGDRELDHANAEE